MAELYKRYRPKKLSQVVGQREAVNMLTDFLRGKKMPHVLLFTGASGTGKTTLARIIANELGCFPGDLREINAAMARGIDEARIIASQVNVAPRGKARVWIVDEAHKLTDDAQNSLLKILEDTPPTAYFALCTTNPTKLIRTIRNRSTEIKTKIVKNDEMESLLNKIIKKEEKTVSQDAVDKIIEYAEGSPRHALVLLNQIIDLPTKEQAGSIENTDVRQFGNHLFNALLKGNFAECCKILPNMDMEPEDIRRYVLAAANNVLIKSLGKNKRSYKIINAFRDDTYASGKAGITAACMECWD